jgi:CO dehydrogenase/acetyl-CoA synthase delta subunit
MRQQQELKEIENLKSKQLSLKLEVEQAHLDEFNGFNQAWDEKMTEFEEKTKAEQEKFEAKQKTEFEVFTETYKNKLPEIPKPSSGLLNLKRIQANLAKQKK